MKTKIVHFSITGTKINVKFFYLKIKLQLIWGFRYPFFPYPDDMYDHVFHKRRGCFSEKNIKRRSVIINRIQSRPCTLAVPWKFSWINTGLS